MDNTSHPKKSLGQHWLHDKASLASIVDSADINSTDTVLEVGPGLGTLTQLLVERAKHVIAVEYDSNLAQQLPDRVSATNLDVQEADILDFDLTALPSSYKVVANIPYYLTSHLIRRLQESPNPPNVCSLLVQKEVAERIVAKPGQMSMLSVSAQFFAEASLGVLVPAELFTPPPKVDSQVVVLRRKTDTPTIDQKVFFRVVKAGFSERRKKLANSLAGGLNIDKTVVQNTLVDQLGLSENVRAQELSVEQWVSLATAMHDILLDK